MKKKHLIIGITLICIAVVILITIIFVLPAVEKSNLRDINNNLDFYGIRLMMSEKELLKNEYLDKEPSRGMGSFNEKMSYWLNNLENGQRARGGGVDNVETEIINNERIVTGVTIEKSGAKCNLYGINPGSSIDEAKVILKEKSFIEQRQKIEENGSGNIFYIRGNIGIELSFFEDGKISYLRIWCI